MKRESGLSGYPIQILYKLINCSFPLIKVIITIVNLYSHKAAVVQGSTCGTAWCTRLDTASASPTPTRTVPSWLPSTGTTRFS